MRKLILCFFILMTFGFAKENFSNGEYNIKKREAELAEKGLKKYLSDLYVYIKE